MTPQLESIMGQLNVPALDHSSSTTTDGRDDQLLIEVLYV